MRRDESIEKVILNTDCVRKDLWTVIFLVDLKEQNYSQYKDKLKLLTDRAICSKLQLSWIAILMRFAVKDSLAIATLKSLVASGTLVCS